MEIITAASVLAADLGALSAEAVKCAEAGVDMIHFDVMDGRFVEQITYGAPVLKWVRKAVNIPIDAHLMVENPARQIDFFAEAGADIIDIHIESDCDVEACLKRIRALGKKSALAVKPGTPAEKSFSYLPLCDMLLIMTVEPGYGGQGFIPEMLPKIEKAREFAEKNGFSIDIEVDGGVNEKTAELCRKAGANVLVAGTALMKAADMKAANSALKGTS